MEETNIVNQRIKNKYYRQFIDDGEIELVTYEMFKQALNNIDNINTGRYAQHKQQQKALLTILYYTGCRPAEALIIQAKDINKKGAYITIHLHTLKRGKPRVMYLPLRDKPEIKAIYDYASKVFPTLYLFHNFKCKYVRKVTKRNGEIVYNAETSARLRNYFKVWFKGILDITPYYLRHNRFSKLALAGVSMQQLRLIKGAKSLESLTPYIHLSSAEAKKVAKKIE